MLTPQQLTEVYDIALAIYKNEANKHLTPEQFVAYCWAKALDEVRDREIKQYANKKHKH
jgi:hypothetical protein